MIFKKNVLILESDLSLAEIGWEDWRKDTLHFTHPALRPLGQLGLKSRMSVGVCFCVSVSVCVFIYMFVQILSDLPLMSDSQLKTTQTYIYFFFISIEDTARYAGLFLAPGEGFGRGFFCPSRKKRAYYAALANFRPFLLSSSNLGNFSSNHSNFEKNP